MSVTFIPSSQEFVQVSDTEWVITGWEVDQGMALFRGPRTKVDAYLAIVQAQLFQPLAGFARMWLGNVEKRNSTANFPSVLKTYVGFRSGNIPPVRRVNGTSSQTVSTSLQVEDPIDPEKFMTITGAFNYGAARTTWTWFESQMPPLLPRYRTISQGINPLDQLTGWNFPPSTDSEGNLVPVSLAQIVEAFNQLIPGAQVMDYEREELVPNTLWACRSVVEWRLTSSS